MTAAARSQLTRRSGGGDAGGAAGAGPLTLTLSCRKECLAVRAQLTSPVQWEATLKELLARGLERSYELGPNKVIAGIMKRTDKTHPMTNIEV